MNAPLYPPARSAAEIRQNLADVQSRIEKACLATGRDPHSVRLLPVSKTISADHLRFASKAGVKLLGENKVQEAYEKWQLLVDTPLQWAIIGHLQTNKVKYVARFASEFQALDSLKLASELDRRLTREGRTLDVFIQINTSQEPQKYGLFPEDAAAFLREMPHYPTLKVRGLMTLALFSGDKEAVRACFIRLRTLRDQLQQINPAVQELSMGMSGDFELAIAEGATTIRIGQAIFGARKTPDREYWPD